MEEILIIGGIGLAVVAVVTPIVAFVNPEVGKAISEASVNLTKEGLKVALENNEFVKGWEFFQGLVAEVAEAKSETKTPVDAHQPPLEAEKS